MQQLRQHPGHAALIANGHAEAAEWDRVAAEETPATGNGQSLPVLDTRPIVVAAIMAPKETAKLRIYRRRSLAERIGTQLATTGRIGRMIRWPFFQWPSLLSFLRAVTGGRVPAARSVARLAECRVCPSRLVMVREKRGKIVESEFCEACHCGTHRLARLPYKATLAKWSCPKRRWKEAYPDDAVRAYLLESGHVTKDQLDVLSAVGCSGCGANSAGTRRE